jgi:Mn-dependent DtxR family transcriptional regulator
VRKGVARTPAVAQDDAVTVALGRLWHVTHLELDAAEVGVSLRRSRRHLDRTVDQAHRLGVIAASALEDAEHMQRIELPLVRRQHLIEQQLGLAEVPDAVGFHRTLQDLVHVHGVS